MRKPAFIVASVVSTAVIGLLIHLFAWAIGQPVTSLADKPLIWPTATFYGVLFAWLFLRQP